MGKFFMKPNELHELVHLPFIIKPEEINKRIAQFRVLLDKASVSDVTRQNESGETILHLMADTLVWAELAKEVIKKYPQLVSIRNNVGIYPIHTAILNENRELLEFLLSIDGPRTDTRGRNIIHHAVHASPEILELCCNAASELIGKTDGEGYTALDEFLIKMKAKDPELFAFFEQHKISLRSHGNSIIYKISSSSGTQRIRVF